MSTLLAKYGTYEEELMGFNPNPIIAHAGGGQGSATALTFKWNRITTCATDGDSVKAIASKRGYEQVIFNSTSNRVSLFPVSGEAINGITDYELSIPAGLSAVLICSYDGEWSATVEDPNSQIFSVSLSITSVQLKSLHSSPLDIIPAPGSGYAIEMISGSGKYTKGTTNYASGGAIMFIVETGVQYQLQDPTSPAVATASYFKKYNTGSGDLVENKKIQIQAANADFINGDGTYKVYGCYRIVKL